MEVLFLGHPSSIKSDETRKNWEVLQKIGNSDLLQISNIRDSSDLQPTLAEMVIDALLGTGTQGKLREPIASAIDIINQSKGIKFAADSPTGHDPLTGKVFDKAEEADYTVTFHKEKSGFKDAKRGVYWETHVCDIGIPQEAEI